MNSARNFDDAERAILKLSIKDQERIALQVLGRLSFSGQSAFVLGGRPPKQNTVAPEKELVKKGKGGGESNRASTNPNKTPTPGDLGQGPRQRGRVVYYDSLVASKAGEDIVPVWAKQSVQPPKSYAAWRKQIQDRIDRTNKSLEDQNLHVVKKGVFTHLVSSLQDDLKFVDFISQNRDEGTNPSKEDLEKWVAPGAFVGSEWDESAKAESTFRMRRPIGEYQDQTLEVILPESPKVDERSKGKKKSYSGVVNNDNAGEPSVPTKKLLRLASDAFKNLTDQ